ncbi:MAG: endopeptidase La [Rickettsiales bacterium]|nr:endopeptidase La [Rickettsiales bacterium]
MSQIKQSKNDSEFLQTIIYNQQSSPLFSNSPIEANFLALPLRDLVIFPKTTNAVLIGRHNSVATVEKAKESNLPIVVVAQIDAENNDFNDESLYHHGTLCNIVESIKTSDGNIKAIIRGLARVKIDKFSAQENLLTCKASIIQDVEEGKSSPSRIGLIKSCIENFIHYAEIDKKINRERISLIAKTENGHHLAYIVATTINFSVINKQEILAISDIDEKLYKIIELLKTEIEIVKTEDRINRKIQEKVAKNHREFYLNEQLKNIKKELGQEENNEIEDLKKKIIKAKMPKEVKIKADSELLKLEKMNPFSSESGIVRSYLEWLVSLPWSEKSKFSNDIKQAKDVLDYHHFGLEKVKERIVEFIAVQMKTKNSNDSRSPILCLVGAPGVGKTSLAKSVAEALGKKYIKISLGGVRDESEIRGHRRTYIGAMPGKIIQSMKRAKTINPLILLDEIDKMSFDFRGDPASAMLEVLDPEQNKSFSDHYLEVEYDLSRVMFVATANNISNIPAPLKDRMEIINLSGYTENEKLHIAKNHLIKQQIKENGLKESEFKINDEALLDLIRKYTFEAGVRNLNRELANLARKAVKEIIFDKDKVIKINKKNLAEYAGSAKYSFGVAKIEDVVGVSTGLAYTTYGGDLLDIEALKFEGSGKIQITGKLGDVMKESAQAALSYARSIGSELKIDAKKFKAFDFHIHVPEGATPKDGPSAGVALCVSLVSAITNIKVRKDIAMTGEITLSGKILAIGGLKEKLLAALRGGIKTVLIPDENKKDLKEMPKEVLDKLKIMPISHIRQALDECLIVKDLRNNKNT